MTDNETNQGVLICGLPCSGNRIVHSLLQHHGVPVQIAHWERGIPKMSEAVRAWEDSGIVEINCIMPLRLEPYRWMSFQARHPEGSGVDVEYNDQGMHHAKHWTPMLRYMAERGIAVLPVVYEDLVARPDDEGRRLMAWLGVYDWRGWPLTIHDGNEKWRERVEAEAEPKIEPPKECSDPGALRTRLLRSHHTRQVQPT